MLRSISARGSSGRGLAISFHDRARKIANKEASEVLRFDKFGPEPSIQCTAKRDRFLIRMADRFQDIFREKSLFVQELTGLVSPFSSQEGIALTPPH